MTRRVYELSTVDGTVPARAPYRAPFRELCNRLQDFSGDAVRTMERYYGDMIQNQADKDAFLDRAGRAWNWLQHYAPEEFRYSLAAGRKNKSDFSESQHAAMKALGSLVNEVNLETVDPKDLNQLIYDKVIHASGCDPKEAFKAIYQKFIGRDQGPRLPGFLKELGRERVNELLEHGTEADGEYPDGFAGKSA
jgi:lysyl-tRNA synthetase class 1